VRSGDDLRFIGNENNGILCAHGGLLIWLNVCRGMFYRKGVWTQSANWQKAHKSPACFRSESNRHSKISGAPSRPFAPLFPGAFLQLTIYLLHLFRGGLRYWIQMGGA